MATFLIPDYAIRRPSLRQGWAQSPEESEAPVQWRGLVGAWAPALGQQGGTLLNVARGVPDGTLTNFALGSAYQGSVHGVALDFAGATFSANDYVSMASTAGITTEPVTMCVTAEWDSYPDTFGVTLMMLTTDIASNLHHRRSLHVVFNGAVEVDSLGVGGQVRARSTTGLVTTGRRYHLCGVWEASDARRVYLDGLPVASNTEAKVVDPPVAVALGIRVHTSDFGGEGRLDGRIYEARLYNAVLPETLIQAIAADPFAVYRRRPRVALFTEAAPGLGPPECMVGASHPGRSVIRGKHYG